MNIDKFLLFWSTNNILIIEVLIAAILLAAFIIGYRMLFSPQGTEADVPAASVDTTQIEKTLQKILQAQSEAQRAPVDAAAAPAVESAKDEAVLVELTQARQSIQEKQAQIEKLMADIAQKPAAVEAPVTNNAAAPEALAKFEAQIKDLEARLAEYEIISEDIADLSRYKEENKRLQQELSALRGGAVPVAAAPEPVAPPAPLASVIEAAAAPAAVAPIPAPAAPAVAAAVAPAAVPAEPASGEASNLIDDELMKEFAAAVEGQRVAEVVPNETDKLMNDFESFIKKG